MNTWTRVSVVGITALSMLGWTAGAYALIPQAIAKAASSTQRTTGSSDRTDKTKVKAAYLKKNSTVAKGALKTANTKKVIKKK